MGDLNNIIEESNLAVCIGDNYGRVKVTIWSENLIPQETYHFKKLITNSERMLEFLEYLATNTNFSSHFPTENIRLKNILYDVTGE